MKKIIVFCLILLGLTFVACGKEKNIEDLLDKEKISSEYNIENEDKTSIKFKDKETLMVSYEEDETQIYEYNIHTFDNSKAELAIIVSVGATRKVLEDELFNMLKEAKSFIKK